MTLVASRMFGRILCSMPFVNFGGPCASDARTLQLLLQRAKETAIECAADTLEVRCAAQLDCDLPLTLRKVSMTLPLSGDPEVLWSAFTSKHRTTIRRALKNGLVVESGGTNLLREFYQVMELTWRDLGTPLYARDYFERIMSTFPQETQIFVCRRKGQPLAAALNGYFSGTVEGLWCGGVAE